MFLAVSTPQQRCCWCGTRTRISGSGQHCATLIQPSSALVTQEAQARVLAALLRMLFAASLLSLSCKRFGFLYLFSAGKFRLFPTFRILDVKQVTVGQNFCHTIYY